jgi:protease I
MRRGIAGFMVPAQRRVLLLAAGDFEDMELLYPLYRLAEEGIAVTVAGLDDHPLRGKKGYGPVTVDATVDQVAAGGFGALVIPGGYAPDKLLRSQAVLALVRAFDQERKPIALHLPCGLGRTGLDQATVVDGHLISARAPTGLGPWMKALLQALGDQPAASHRALAPDDPHPHPSVITGVRPPDSMHAETPILHPSPRSSRSQNPAHTPRSGVRGHGLPLPFRS